jgi:hypothetical protein
MVKHTDFIPGFLDKKQTQHYAFSWVEFIAHKKLNGLKQISDFSEQYPHVLYRQDAWLSQFQYLQRKLQDRNAQALVALYNDVITGEVTTLTGAVRQTSTSISIHLMNISMRSLTNATR